MGSMTDHHAGVANATTTRSNDKGYNPTVEGSAQRRGVEPNDGKAEPNNEGQNPMTEGRTQRRKAEPNDEGRTQRVETNGRGHNNEALIH